MLNRENNPWLGLASYEYEDAYRFFGREKELASLKETVCNNLITTIYGISGAGKTSFINAGMCPLLEKENYLPVRIRLEHCSGKPYSEQIINSVQNAISKINGEIEISSKIETKKTAEDGEEIDLIPEEERLWLFFHSSLFWSATNHQICPVIFIDQFEEIFTKNENLSVVQAFFNCINSLQYDVPPAATAKLLEEQEIYADLNTTKNFRLVFIMREDFLARLEDYAYEIPALRKNRIGIKRMNGLQTLDVILRPMPEVVNKEVALSIISKVSGCPAKNNLSYLEHLSIDTSILSLFCSELYFKAVEQKQDIISHELIEQFGENILFSFYDTTMEFVSPRTMEYLETHLLTRSGYRNAVALEDILDAGIKKEELDKLSAKRLIRVETANGTERVEYTHDVLCAIAKEHRDKRIDKDNRQSNVYRNIGFIFDTCLAFATIFIFLFALYVEGNINNIIGYTTKNIFLQISIFFTLIFPLFVLSYRHTKDRNAIWTSLVTLIVNCFTLLLFIIGITNLSSDLAIIFLAINATYPLFQFFNAFRFNKKHNFKESVKYIYELKIYSDYPFFKTVLKYMLFAMIIYMSFLVGLSLNVTCSYISIPICSLLGFMLLAEYANVPVKSDKKSIAVYVIATLLLLVLIKAQFYHHHISIMLAVWILLWGATFYYVNKNTEESTWKKKLGITIFIWSISMFLVPMMNIGYNVLNHTAYVRVPNGTINSYQIVRFLIIEDAHHKKGVRDRWSIVIPTEYDSIVNKVLINMNEWNGLMALETSRAKHITPEENWKIFYDRYHEYKENCDNEIVFRIIKGTKANNWLCSEHLDLDNLCTKMLLRNLQKADKFAENVKYLRHLYVTRNEKSYSEYNKRLRECFAYQLWKDYDTEYFDDLKNGKNSIPFYQLNNMLASNLELLTLDRDREVSQLLLDTIYPRSMNVPDSCVYYHNLSCFKLYARNFKGAELSARHTIAKDSTWVVAYAKLIEALYMQEKYELAFSILQKHKDDKIYTTATYNVYDSTFTYLRDVIGEDFLELIKYGIYTDVQSKQYIQLKSILEDDAVKPKHGL